MKNTEIIKSESVIQSLILLMNKLKHKKNNFIMASEKYKHEYNTTNLYEYDEQLIDMIRESLFDYFVDYTPTNLLHFYMNQIVKQINDYKYYTDDQRRLLIKDINECKTLTELEKIDPEARTLFFDDVYKNYMGLYKK